MNDENQVVYHSDTNLALVLVQVAGKIEATVFWGHQAFKLTDLEAARLSVKTAELNKALLNMIEKHLKDQQKKGN
jgi:hypothetical protein